MIKLKRLSDQPILLPNKDASLFPEKIKGKYVMFHRREPDIWLAYSDDLKTWYDHKIIMKPESRSMSL